MRQIIIVTLLSILISVTSFAQSARRDGGSTAAAAQAQYLLRQITAERDAMKGELAALKAEIEKKDKKISGLKEKLVSMRSAVSRSRDVIGKFQDNNSMVRDRFMAAREKMQKLVDKFREVVAIMRKLEKENVEMKTALTKHEKDIEQCSAKNVKLLSLNKTIITAYQDKSVWDALRKTEPLTGLERTNWENMVEQFKDQAYQLKHQSSMAP